MDEERFAFEVQVRAAELYNTARTLPELIRLLSIVRPRLAVEFAFCVAVLIRKTPSSTWAASQKRIVAAWGVTELQCIQLSLKVFLKVFPTPYTLKYVRFLVQMDSDAAIRWMEIDLDLFMTSVWRMALGMITPETFFRGHVEHYPLPLFIYQRYCFEPRHLLHAIASYPHAKALVRRFEAMSYEDQRVGFSLFDQSSMSGGKAWRIFQALRSEKKSI